MDSICQNNDQLNGKIQNDNKSNNHINQCDKKEKKQTLENQIKGLFLGKFQEAPDFAKDNKFIHTGYRIGINNFKSSIKSLFMVHNEMVNIWSHFCGAILVISLLIYVMATFGNSFSTKLTEELNTKFELFVNQIKDIDQALNNQLDSSLDSLKKDYTKFNNFMQELKEYKETNVEFFWDRISQLPQQLEIYVKKLIQQEYPNEDECRIPLEQISFKDSLIKLKNKLINKIDSEEFDWLDLHLSSIASLTSKYKNQSESNKVSRWPLFVFLFSAFLCLMFSACFHLFFVISPKVNQVMLRLDYAGVNLLISGSTFPLFYYSFYCQTTWSVFYLSLIGIACLVVFFVSLKDFIHTPKYWTLKSVMYGSLGLFAAVPMIHLAIQNICFNNFDDPFKFSEAIFYYLLMGVCYLGGLTIYAKRFPEKHFPGKFDIWGHSHQLWHISILIAIGFTYVGGVLNYLNRKQTAVCPIQQ